MDTAAVVDLVEPLQTSAEQIIWMFLPCIGFDHREEVRGAEGIDYYGSNRNARVGSPAVIVIETDFFRGFPVDDPSLA
jgi:hypothetical protein